MIHPIEADKELDKILAGILKFINSNGRDGLDIYGARELLLAWRDKHTGAACWQLLNDIEQSLSSHTTPEGKDLLTRSYIKNTIEFERMKLRNRPSQLGAKDE